MVCLAIIVQRHALPIRANVVNPQRFKSQQPAPGHQRSVFTGWCDVHQLRHPAEQRAVNPILVVAFEVNDLCQRAGLAQLRQPPMELFNRRLSRCAQVRRHRPALRSFGIVHHVTQQHNAGRLQQRGHLDSDIPRTSIVQRLKPMLALPGDILVCGTPTGAGARFDPPIWLQPGDVIEVEAEGIGILRNGVEDEA